MLKKFAAELVGTMVLVLFGCGAAVLGGSGGGGRPDMAQAGGPEPENAAAALAAIEHALGGPA